MDKIQEQWPDYEKKKHKLHPELDLLELATRISISRAAIKERVVPPEYISQSTEIIGYEWAHDGVKVVIPDMASLLKDFGRTTRKDADDRNFYFGNDLIIEGDAEKKEDKKSYQIRERNRIINKSRKIFDEENTYNITPEEEKKCQKMLEKYKKRFLKQTTIAPLQQKDGKKKETEAHDILEFIRIRTKKLKPPGEYLVTISFDNESTDGTEKLEEFVRNKFDIRPMCDPEDCDCEMDCEHELIHETEKTDFECEKCRRQLELMNNPKNPSTLPEAIKNKKKNLFGIVQIKNV